MKPLQVIAVAALLGLAPSATGATPVARGRLSGLLTRSPITPVCRVGVPCGAPDPDVVLRFASSRLVTTTRSDAHGRYRVALPAGTYSVSTSQRPFGRIPDPAVVRIRAGQSETVDFSLDTGIR